MIRRPLSEKETAANFRSLDCPENARASLRQNIRTSFQLPKLMLLEESVTNTISALWHPEIAIKGKN